MKKIFISAGEASGDLHASKLVSSLKARNSGLKFFGLGGSLLEEEGVELLYGVDQLAVTGFWEVAKRILHFRKVYHDCLKEIDKQKPDLAILVDYPGLNLKLAKALKQRRIKVVYFIIPQVWAWKEGRVKKLEERVDLLIPILPFEEKLFSQSSLKCKFTGHPLIDIIPENVNTGNVRNKLGVSESQKIIALMPGSRKVEIDRHYKTMLQAAKLLQESIPDLIVLTMIRKEYDKKIYQEIENKVKIKAVHIHENIYEILHTTDISIVASGTATLEAALCGKPFCIVYKTGLITYLIAKSVIKLEMIGMPNIIAGKKIVSEFIQSEMTAENLGSFCKDILTDPEKSNSIQKQLLSLRNQLGSIGAIERAATLISDEFF